MPSAKIVKGETYSTVSDYLGTPCLMYNHVGNLVWQAELDIYGKIRTLERGSIQDCPFRYQGQYEDAETGLYYNRFRYYSPESGTYISQDPIGLVGNNPNIYAYVSDSNVWVDVLGLTELKAQLIKFFYKRNNQVHYKVAFPGTEEENVTHLTKNSNNKILIKTDKYIGNDNDIVDSIDVIVKKEGDDAVSAVSDIKNKYTGKKYKLNKMDCFSYAEEVLRRLGANINPKGKDNAAKFKSLKGCN
ncbi:RHS repeat-associated core domain-containing protein [Rapidithrix thailandica]|uniref:RHS repeat-associated core domain-containing protein n=1 Tax=Rapidithrix thailandica TaxID=413964 RepID=A0AAW9SFQ7_9BACT